MAAELHVFRTLTIACAVLVVDFVTIWAQADSDISVLVRSPVATSSEATTITVYRGDVQRMVTFDKAVLLGNTLDNQRLQFRNNNPRIPNGAISITSTEPATLTLPVTMTTAERTGIYSITVTEDDGAETILRVLVTNEDATVTAAEYSTVVSQSDSVTVSAVPGTGVSESVLRWRRDGVFDGDANGMMSFPTITAGNSEVFECFKSGRYSQNIHAIMNLVVRGCPKDKTGAGCGEECHHCFNGGVCSDETVSCLCPPGFSGDNCESVHGRNVFGENAEYQCDDTADDHSDGCEGAIICYPEPFGCTCPAGYMGIDCMQECGDGKFGANCKQDCHCQNGVSCSKDTGECDNNQCADGWKGVNCQVEVPCEIGWFGDLCTLPCACPSGPCTDVESNCDAGCAATWTGVACDENSGNGVITDLTYVKVNPGVQTSVTCSAVRNPVLGENDLNLQVSGGAPATLSSSSVSGERQYTRSNTWTVTLQSDPVVTADCSISGTTTSQTVQLVPYELLQYSPDRSAQLSFYSVLSTSIVMIWPLWLDNIDIGDGPIKEYVIEYREEGGSTFTEGVRTASLSTQITGLNVDTLYEFRIVLVRDGPNGDGPPSDIQTQRTLCGVISMLPSLTLETTTARAATFRFEIPPMDQWMCSSITASLQRQQSDGQWMDEESLSTTSGTVTVSDLIPCTSYTYRVQIDSTQSIANSMPEDVRTQPEALVVSDLSVSAATTGQLDVTWSPPDTSQTNCILSVYTVIYRVVKYVACGSDVTESMYMTETTTLTSITLSDLSDYAEYDVIVRADGEVDGIEISEVGTTLQAAPSIAPRNISLSDCSSTCLEFTWQPLPCDKHNGDTISYQYSLYFFNGTSNDTAVPGTSTAASGVELCHLTPYFKYYFKVRASTSVGQGPYSDIVSKRTEEDVPPQLDPPEFPFTNASSLWLLWNTPNPPHGVITGYDISVQLVDDVQSNMSFVDSVDAEEAGDPPSYIVTDLEALRNYSIMVRANTRIGPGEWSLPAVSTTKKGLPSSPRNVIISQKSQTEITIEWDIPENPRGDIITYEICNQAIERPYSPGFTVMPCRAQNINNTDTHIIHTITSLEPSTVYRIEVSAYTSAGQGDISSITVSTDVTNELQPVQPGDIPRLTRDGTSAVITLPRLTDTYATHYFIRVKSNQVAKRSVGGIGSYDDNPNDYITAEIKKGEEEGPFTIGDGKMYGMYENVPLEEGKEYEIYVGTGSKVGENAEVVWSPPLSFSDEFPTFVVVAVVLVIVVIVFFVVTVVIVRRKILAKRNKDGIHVHAVAGKEKGSFGDIAMRGKSGKPGIQIESGDYDETEVKPSGRKTESTESGYMEPTGQQLERGSHVYMEPTPVLKNEYETCRNPLSEDGYENSVVRDRGVSVKKLENAVGRKLPTTPQTHTSGSLHNPSETYEVPDVGISQAKGVVPHSIKIKDLPDCLQNKDMGPEDTVGDEFSKLLHGKQHSWTVGALKDEHPSSGILPYDHSRVKLEKNSSDSNFDYYNANFIKDQHNEKGFVAAQGPTAKTLETFWRIIWDHNIEMIVNLTEVNGAAHQYWPTGTETVINKYGDLTIIWCDNLLDCCDYLVRELKVIKGDKVHEVKLCHFLSWPEASFPLQPAVVLDFIKKVKASRKKFSLPILVHCSNGVGATGTFITIYSLLEGLKDTRKSRGNVFDFVTKMRKNRVDMVQNESQYTFVYETLTTALLTPETAMSEENLLEMDLDVQKGLLIKQHEVLTALTKVIAPRRSLVGQSQENASKNRFQKVIPLDSCRAILKSPGCCVGNNDYINASLVNSPYLRDGFIMTQAPLAATVEDFWRMIYDYQCAAIVSLNEMNENDEEVCFYWPQGGKVQYGNMSVKCTDVTTRKDAYTERHLIVKHQKFEKEVPLHHYQLLTWPKAKHQRGALLEILFKVQPLMKSKQRVAVHCLDGVKRSGVFVAVATEIMHSKTDKQVDMFQAILKLRGKIPQIITELEDYCLCYQLLKSSSAAEESAYASIGE